MGIYARFSALARPLAASPRVFATVVRLVRRSATDLPIAPATAARKPSHASVPDRCR
jgi:hypothetical protein